MLGSTLRSMQLDGLNERTLAAATKRSKVLLKKCPPRQRLDCNLTSRIGQGTYPVAPGNEPLPDVEKRPGVASVERLLGLMTRAIHKVKITMLAISTDVIAQVSESLTEGNHQGRIMSMDSLRSFDDASDFLLCNDVFKNMIVNVWGYRRASRLRMEILE